MLSGAHREFVAVHLDPSSFWQYLLLGDQWRWSSCQDTLVRPFLVQQMHCCQRTGNLGAAVEEVAAIEDLRAAAVTRQCAASRRHSLPFLFIHLCGLDRLAVTGFTQLSPLIACVAAGGSRRRRTLWRSSKQWMCYSHSVRLCLHTISSMSTQSPTCDFRRLGIES
jgi:hypothetical protein